MTNQSNPIKEEDSQKRIREADGSERFETKKSEKSENDETEETEEDDYEKRSEEKRSKM